VNDPIRIREGGSDVPSDLKDLFAHAKRPESLPAAIDTRMAAHVGVLGALPVSSLVKVMPWLVGGGAVMLAGAITLVVQRRAPMPQPIPSEPTQVTAPALVPVPIPAPDTVPETKSSPPPTAAHSTPAEAASASEDALAVEAKLLNQAHDAMATDPRKALSIASEHAKRYPHGQLAAERELILVQALVKLGRAREAEARGRALRKNTPNSIYGERLDTILHGK
jgi:hypothetical protein